MRVRHRLLLSGAGVLALAAAACGGGADGSRSAGDSAGGAAGDSASGAAGGGSTAAPAGAGRITVFAAASLTDAFSELGTAFAVAHPGADVGFSFAGSSELVAQVLDGAPADVVASADEPTMARLTAAGATAGEPVVFATNSLEIAVAPGNPEGVDEVADLARRDLVVVTCAPEVPCGAYAATLFADAGVAVTPASYEASVRAVTTKVALGEADAGIVYATDVVAADDEVDGVAIPAELDVVARYPIAISADAADPATARAFVDFVVGDAGRAILADHGFAAP